MPRLTWFCVDIECSGPVPALYDMISLGAVRVHHTGERYEVGIPFYMEICPSAPRVDAGAMAVNGLDLDRLKLEGLPLKQAMASLTHWVQEQTIPETKPSFVGHNAPFDWSFVNHAYVATGLNNPFGYKALDTKALAMGVLGVHWLDANKERLQVELSLPEFDETQVHRADYDAWIQALILVGLLERRPSCADL
jgi:DNA polymerase III alpha subunit (gram-positive type)